MKTVRYISLPLSFSLNKKVVAQTISASEFPYWFGPIRVRSLAPLPDHQSITAAEVRTTQHLLVSISDRESPHISSGLGRVSRWRVGAIDKITSDTYGSVLSPWPPTLPDLCPIHALLARADTGEGFGEFKPPVTNFECHFVTINTYHKTLIQILTVA